MSIQSYARPDDLPPPVITGSTIQTFTNVWGDVMVAKNGVNGGAWRKALDVLHAVVYRNAAYTIPTATTVITYDTVWRDTYGMWVQAGPYFVCPVAGWYRYQFTMNGTASGVNQYIQLYGSVNGTSVSGDNNTTALTGGGLSARSSFFYYNLAGDQIKASGYQNVANAGQTGYGNCRFEMSYMGSG